MGAAAGAVQVNRDYAQEFGDGVTAQNATPDQTSAFAAAHPSSGFGSLGMILAMLGPLLPLLAPALIPALGGALGIGSTAARALISGIAGAAGGGIQGGGEGALLGGLGGGLGSLAGGGLQSLLGSGGGGLGGAAGAVASHGLDPILADLPGEIAGITVSPAAAAGGAALGGAAGAAGGAASPHMGSDGHGDWPTDTPITAPTQTTALLGTYDPAGVPDFTVPIPGFTPDTPGYDPSKLPGSADGTGGGSGSNPGGAAPPTDVEGVTATAAPITPVGSVLGGITGDLGAFSPPQLPPGTAPTSQDPDPKKTVEKVIQDILNLGTTPGSPLAPIANNRGGGGGGGGTVVSHPAVDGGTPGAAGTGGPAATSPTGGTPANPTAPSGGVSGSPQPGLITTGAGAGSGSGVGVGGAGALDIRGSQAPNIYPWVGADQGSGL